MSSMYGGTGYRSPMSQGAGQSTGSMLQSGGSRSKMVPKGYEQIQNFSPEQMQLFQQLFSHTGPDSFLSKLAGGDPSQFEANEAPAYRQFNELQGQTASRFSQGGGGRGALSSRNSSGFQNQMSAAGSNFAQDLQSQRQGLQRQALQDLMGMSNSLLDKNPYSLTPKKKPYWQELLTALAGGIGGFAGNAGGIAGMKGLGLI